MDRDGSQCVKYNQGIMRVLSACLMLFFIEAYTAECVHGLSYNKSTKHMFVIVTKK